MSENLPKVKIKELKEEDKGLWYYEHQGEKFPLFYTLEKGVVVIHDDGKGNTRWLVRAEHCEIAD